MISSSRHASHPLYCSPVLRRYEDFIYRAGTCFCANFRDKPLRAVKIVVTKVVLSSVATLLAIYFELLEALKVPAKIIHLFQTDWVEASQGVPSGEKQNHVKEFRFSQPFDQN